MMQFGLTQFGKTIGAITLVSASALAQADLAGHNEVTKIFSSNGQATATVSGYGRRVANNKPATATARATANTARAKVTFKPLPSVALTTAIANTARAKVYFSAWSLVDGYATAIGYGDSRRHIKIYPLRAQCTAEGEAEPQTWQMAYAMPAVATATGFGTTYHLAYGTGISTATIEDHPRLTIGGHGTALCSALAQNTARKYQIGVKGIGLVTAIGNGDPAYKRAGVRYFEVNGDAHAYALALSTTVGITQAQTGRGFATAEGHARFQLGGKGKGTCTAVGYGAAESMGTGATAAPGNTSATGYGKAQANKRGKGSAACSATGYGSGERKVTKQYPLPANSYAYLLGGALRTALVYGQAQANAQVQTLFVGQSVQLRPGEAFATLNQPRVQLNLYPERAEASAEILGTSKKWLYAAGVGSCTATAYGFNEVNDLVPAPAERTVTVEVFPRLVVVEEQPRLILV